MTRDQRGPADATAPVPEQPVTTRLADVSEEHRFRLLVEAVTDYAIYMIDADGFVASWNTGAQRLKQYAPREIIGQHYSRFFTEEDRRRGLPQRALEVARLHGRYEAEGWRVRKDGTRFWAFAVVDTIRNERGEILGFAKITRDNTERRKAQEALEQSERQFRLLVEGVVDYAIFMLDPNGIITNWNAGAQRIKQYNASEIIGQHFSKFYTDADRMAGLPARALQIAAAEGRYESEGLRVRKNGERFWANAVIDAIRDETGQLVGFAKITRDITEKRDAQLSLQRAQEQLAQSQKMEALGQLTGGIAHDFNNLLMVVSGHAQTMRKRTTDAKMTSSIDAILLAATRGATLTRQLLGFSRRQHVDPVPVDLRGRVEALKELLASSLRGGVKLVVDIPPAIWPIMVDEGELELTLLNLALNARDAMPDGGVVTLAAENMTLRKTSELPLEGEFVALSVSDIGTGIPPDVLPRIFEPFFTTKEIGRGTGLGLSQVYGFAQQSGGRVVARSEMGRGTTMTIYIPRTRAALREQTDSADADHMVHDGRILVVEDNSEVAAVSRTLLEQLGFEVTVVSDAVAALQTLSGGQFQLVFSDIVMAGEQDGLMLAATIKQRFPDTPILLTSGYSRAADRAELSFPILRKPYQISTLRKAVAEAISRGTRKA
jgi:PAS domain S-box-containing protein